MRPQEPIPDKHEAFPLGTEDVDGRRETVFGVLFPTHYRRDGSLSFVMTTYRRTVEELVGPIPRNGEEDRRRNGAPGRRNGRVGTHGHSHQWSHRKGAGPRRAR